jgi:hypothetical protein
VQGGESRGLGFASSLTNCGLVTWKVPYAWIVSWHVGQALPGVTLFSSLEDICADNFDAQVLIAARITLCRIKPINKKH